MATSIPVNRPPAYPVPGRQLIECIVRVNLQPWVVKGILTIPRAYNSVNLVVESNVQAIILHFTLIYDGWRAFLRREVVPLSRQRRSIRNIKDKYSFEDHPYYLHLL